MTDSTTRAFRVTVRGRFHELTEQAQSYLKRAQPEHDIFVSAYTPEGTFQYDDRIQFFSFRIEVKATSTEQAIELGQAEAEMFLKVMKYGYRVVRVTAADMNEMWTDTR